MYASILVPVDGSEFSGKAIKEASRLAQALGSRLVLFYAVPRDPLPPITEGMSVAGRPQQREEARKRMEAEAQAVLAAAAQNVELPKHRIESHHAISDSPYEAIIDAAKNKECEVIVMASHGRRGVAGVVLGSETQKVLTHSRVPVLVVR